LLVNGGGNKRRYCDDDSTPILPAVAVAAAVTVVAVAAAVTVVAVAAAVTVVATVQEGTMTTMTALLLMAAMCQAYNSSAVLTVMQQSTANVLLHSGKVATEEEVV